MKAVRLRTEYLVNPIGIDIVAPRLYWNAEGGKKQTAYQIIAKSGGKIIWNTGKVASSRMIHILYEGQSLHSREKVYWSVKLWDENGEGGEMSTVSLKWVCWTHTTGKPSGSPETIRSRKVRGILSIASASIFPLPRMWNMHGCTSQPAGFTKQNWTNNGLAISC